MKAKLILTFGVLFALTAACHAQLNPTGRAGQPCTIRVFEDGEWNGGNAEWINGASVLVRPRYSNDVPGHLVEPKTTVNGQVTFGLEPTEQYTITVTKPGFAQAERIYLMPNYHAYVNIALKPIQVLRPIDGVSRYGKPLTVRVFVEGEWNGGNAQWVNGATVMVQRYPTPALLTQSQTKQTVSGQATFTLTPAKQYKITVSKNGFAPAERIYLMPNYNGVVNIALDPFDLLPINSAVRPGKRAEPSKKKPLSRREQLLRRLRSR